MFAKNPRNPRDWREIPRENLRQNPAPTHDAWLCDAALADGLASSPVSQNARAFAIAKSSAAKFEFAALLPQIFTPPAPPPRPITKSRA